MNSPAWVNALLKWRKEDYRGECPFRRQTRRVQAAEQKKSSRPPTTAEQAQAQTAKANAERAKAEAAKAKAEEKRATAEAQIKKAEAAAVMFRPATKRIPSESRDALIAALGKLASASATERADAAIAVERERASLGLTWPELIVPAAAEIELRQAA